MGIIRRKTKIVKIGNLHIGGNYPVAIQSMGKTPTSRIQASLNQIKQLQLSGCEIIRLAVKDTKDAQAIAKIKKGIKIPLVADIHFNWKLALEAIEHGADKIRLNPGNIYKKEQIREIVREAKIAHIPIRVGVNSGSVRRQNTGNQQLVNSMVKSAIDYIRIIEKNGFYDLVVSLKASDIFDTILAYRKMAELCDYPFHIGVTATGLPQAGMIKSSIAIAALLLDGIGDTIRVSLTDNPQEEVKAAKLILESLGLRNFGPQVISCPTCGRCEVNLIKIVSDLENKLNAIGHTPGAKPIKVAVMGCVVNGPGEAMDADIGVAFGKKEGLLFKHGKAIKKISYGQCNKILLDAIRRDHA